MSSATKAVGEVIDGLVQGFIFQRGSDGFINEFLSRNFGWVGQPGTTCAFVHSLEDVLEFGCAFNGAKFVYLAEYSVGTGYAKAKAGPIPYEMFTKLVGKDIVDQLITSMITTVFWTYRPSNLETAQPETQG